MAENQDPFSLIKKSSMLQIRIEIHKKLTAKNGFDFVTQAEIIEFMRSRSQQIRVSKIEIKIHQCARLSQIPSYRHDRQVNSNLIGTKAEGDLRKSPLEDMIK
jgi:hypothetical protein